MQEELLEKTPLLTVLTCSVEDLLLLDVRVLSRASTFLLAFLSPTPTHRPPPECSFHLGPKVAPLGPSNPPMWQPVRFMVVCWPTSFPPGVGDEISLRKLP